MSRRKHLEEQMLVTPTVEENQTVARVVKLHGSNIVQVEFPKTNQDGSKYVAPAPCSQTKKKRISNEKRLDSKFAHCLIDPMFMPPNTQV